METIADDVEIEHDGSSDAFAVSCKTTPDQDCAVFMVSSRPNGVRIVVAVI